MATKSHGSVTARKPKPRGRKPGGISSTKETKRLRRVKIRLILGLDWQIYKRVGFDMIRIKGQDAHSYGFI